MVQSGRKAVASVALLLLLGLVPAAAEAAGPCPSAASPSVRPYAVTYDDPLTPSHELVTATGYQAYPKAPARFLVILSHGFTTEVGQFKAILADLADAGAAAVALDFRGDRYAYKVHNATEDNAAAIADWTARCPIHTVIVYGGSMGGQISALTAMKYPAGIDYLVAENAPTDLPELWATLPPAGVALAAFHQATTGVAEPCGQPAKARIGHATGDAAAIAASVQKPFHPGDANSNLCAWGMWSAKQIEAEMGGPPVGRALPAYIDYSPALNPTEWFASGLKHAYLAYNSADLVVPTDHGVQLTQVLQAAAIPTNLYVVPYYGEPSAPSKGQGSQFFADVKDDGRDTVAEAKQDPKDPPLTKDVPFPEGLALPKPAMHSKSIGLSIVFQILAGTVEPVAAGGVEIPLTPGLATPNDDLLAGAEVSIPDVLPPAGKSKVEATLRLAPTFVGPITPDP